MSVLAAFARPRSWPVAKPPFTLTIEPGHEEMWLAIRQMPNAKRMFTAFDLAQATGSTESRAQRYLLWLVRSDFARLVGKTTDQQDTFAIVRLQVDPVVFDSRGNPASDWERRRAIWRQIRSFRTFTIEQLWQVLSTHELVRKADVETYVARLSEADYLIELAPMRRMQGCWQLRPARNTGPLPPRLCEASLIYDVNSGAFFGRGLAHEVTL